MRHRSYDLHQSEYLNAKNDSYGGGWVPLEKVPIAQDEQQHDGLVTQLVIDFTSLDQHCLKLRRWVRLLTARNLLQHAADDDAVSGLNNSVQLE